MNLVHENRNEKFVPNSPKDGVLKRWLMANTRHTVRKFIELEESNFKKPLTINRKFSHSLVISDFNPLIGLFF